MTEDAPLDTELMPLDPRRGKVFWPRALRYCADKFLSRPDVMVSARLKGRAGEIIIAAVNAGMLQDVPGIVELVRKYAEVEKMPRRMHRGAVRTRCPMNLFIDIAGGHMVPVFNGPKGLEVIGPQFGGLAPQLGFPTDTLSDDAQRYSDTCRLLADLIEAEQLPAAPVSSAAEKDIPNPSAPHSLKSIAAAWGGQMTARKLKPMIGTSVRGKSLNRETWIVCLDDLPVAARRKLAPTDTNSR